MLNLRNKSEYWNETFHLAFQALWSNKLRAGLTMLGVIIGSGCIVLVVTVALVGKRYIITQIEGVGSNLVYAGLTHSSNPSRLALSDEISPGDFDAVKSDIPQVMVATSAPTSATTSGVFSLLNRRVNDFEDTPCGSEEEGNPPSEDMPQLIENVGGPARIRT